jgi:hypothetical protein
MGFVTNQLYRDRIDISNCLRPSSRVITHNLPHWRLYNLCCSESVAKETNNRPTFSNEVRVLPCRILEVSGLFLVFGYRNIMTVISFIITLPFCTF